LPTTGVKCLATGASNDPGRDSNKPRAAVNKPALAPLTVCLSPRSHAGTPAQARSGNGRWPAATAAAVSLATSCHASNNYLKLQIII